jgi:hypothetical protein
VERPPLSLVQASDLSLPMAGVSASIWSDFSPMEVRTNHLPMCTCPSGVAHDTQTHYLMEQDPLLLKNQADGMDVVVVADKVEALKKKDGPSRARLKSIWLSILHV